MSVDKMIERVLAGQAPRTVLGEMAARPPAGTPTGTNVFALRRLFQGYPGPYTKPEPAVQDRVPNRIESVSVPHIKRCLKAGLCRIEGQMLVLTDAGKEAIKDYERHLPPR